MSGQEVAVCYAKVRVSDGFVVNTLVARASVARSFDSRDADHRYFPCSTPAGATIGRGDTVILATGEPKPKPKPEPTPTRHSVAIKTFGKKESEPKDHFGRNEVVNIKATFTDRTLNRTIAVPVDRIDSNGNILEHDVLWLKLEVVNGVGKIARKFPGTGRYGVGFHTSEEFDVPETNIIIFH